MHKFWLAAASLGMAPAAALAAGAEVPAPPALAAPAPVDPARWAPFDARIARAKSTMMANPEQGLAQATAAARYATVQPGSTQRIVALATAHWLQGEALIRLQKPTQADPILGEALGQVQRYQPGSKLHGDLLQSNGSVSAQLGRIQQALEDFQAAHAIFQKLDEARGQAMSLTYIGMIYNDAHDYERVLQYQAQATEAYSGDPAFTVSTHNNRGNALRELGRYPVAEAEYRQAFVAAQKLDSALLTARVLTNIASAQELSGRLAEADATANRGLRIAAADTAAGWRPFLWGVKAQVAFKRGDLPDAAAYIARTFDGANLAHTTMPYREFHGFAHTLYAKLGDDRLALAHLEAFKRLEDESRTLAANTNAALMSARFDFANQDLRIAKLKTGQLERDVTIANARARLHRIVLIVAGSAALLIFGLLSFGYFSIRRSRNETRAANRNLSTANTQLEKALKAKTEFLATTSHEIRTPLNGILGMTQVILHDPAIEGPLRERLQVVQGAGETMKALVDDLLDVAKMETGKLAIHRDEMDLRHLLEDVVRLWSGQARGKNVGLELGLGEAPRRIVEDETRLRQILFNLLSNAIKFTEVGTVHMAVSTEGTDTGELLHIRIQDSGIGIPAEQLARIFESFHQVDGGVTRRYSGTGLGLAICRNLSQAMGGDVAVESVLGEGSCFTLTLPLTRVAAPQSAKQAEPDGPRPLAERRLLLVDRNPLAQSIVRAVIEKEVASFATADSGDDAILLGEDGNFDEVIVENASATVGNLDRTESVRALAAALPAATITLLVPELTESVRDALIAAGAHRVLGKPISAKSLLEAVKCPAVPAPNTSTLADRKSAA